ncbi:MAG: tetratricopeptide repeat protein [Devosia sp.]
MGQLIRGAGAALLLAALAMPLPALAVDTGGNDTTEAPAVPTLDEARADIKANDWDGAIAKLKLIVAANPNSADAYNLLGYSFRNAGNTTRAGQAYDTALKLDPSHKGALEYQGVLFVKLGETEKAKANLAKLKTLCGTDCEEYEDLAKAIGG